MTTVKSVAGAKYSRNQLQSLANVHKGLSCASTVHLDAGACEQVGYRAPPPRLCPVSVRGTKEDLG